MLIYKILRGPEWTAFRAAGVTRGAPVDLADGFIHLSTAEQLPVTAAKHFGGETGLILMAVQASGLDALRWERSRGGALFPHLYRPLEADDVVWARPIRSDAAGHLLPLDPT